MRWDGDVRTYADVADTLPRDVREAIETSLPCPVAVDRVHLWDEGYPLAFPAGTGPGWFCVHCGAATRTAPVPPVNRPGALLSAGQVLGMLR